MRVLLINEMCGYTSTGRIACELADELSAQGHECRVAYGRKPEVPEKWKHYAVRIGTDWDVKKHALRTRLLDEAGFGSQRPTGEFLKWADEFNPDLVWLHNIHGYYINIEMLFAWIKSRPQMKVKWTLHDCWAFTGHCAYFTMEKCEKWKNGCYDCPQKKSYPASFMRDNSANNFVRKKSIFTGVKDLTLITPSQWLADLVQCSFLGEYPVEVHHNKIDREIFRPRKSNFRKKYEIEDKIMILGVANVWEPRKGLPDFYQLAKLLDDSFRIVLVGLSDKQVKACAPNMIGIQKTNNPQELAEIYSTADVLFNPTYEDNYPTVNLEAEACGTPVITYRTGGAPETIHRADSQIVSAGNLERVLDLLRQI